MKKLVILALFVCNAGISAHAQKSEMISKKSTSQHADDFTWKIVSALNNTWGYDIYWNNKLTVHQLTIPALPGNQGFKTKEAAQKVAELVIKKIKKGEMPPTVVKEELKKLNAL